VPSPAGVDRDLEAEAAVGIHRGGAVAIRLDDELAAKVAVAVSRPEPELATRPACRDAAAAHQPSALHFENIRKVAADRNLEVEADGFAAVIGNVDVFVDAALADRAAELQ
jgi:hypothetical protein